MDNRLGSRLARDARSTMDLTESIYQLPSSADLRAPSIPAKRYQDSTSKSIKRKGTTDSSSPTSSLRISLTQYNGRGYFLTTTAAKATKRSSRLHAQKEAHMEHMHQSTCLNLSTGNDESDLWILPDFDEWEFDGASPTQDVPPQRAQSWAPLVSRAVNSNRERLRRRLEGDGWDFVGGRYGEDGAVLKEAEEDGGSEESVDEEFDVVVLPAVSVAC